MLAASQDIDRFIERQRSKLNKQSFQQPVNRQPPLQQSVNQPPPPPPPSFQPSNIEDRLDFKVARILDEPPPRFQSQQPFQQPAPPPSFAEQQMNFLPQQQRRSSHDDNENNSASFFNRFGTYDDKRSQLKDDLKREYNDYLHAQKGLPKSKSSTQLLSPRGNNTRHVQFQQPNGKVVAPWEKNESKSATNTQNMNNSSSTVISHEYSTNRSRTQTSPNHNEQYIRDREEYILELHSQIRELEARKRQFEIDGSRLSAGSSSMVTRAHHTEDLNALNSLLAERLDQRSAVDHELARILNRPPVSSSPTRVITGGVSNLHLSNEQSQQGSSQMYQQQNGRHVQTHRNDNRSGTYDNGFQIGRESDKDAEQATKKRYQQELQSQMREAQMRKAQAKQDKDEYERKLDADVQRYNYFGRSGGGAPMRDKDGNVVANLADVRNPPPPSQQQPPTNRQQQQQQQQQQQPYFGSDDKVYSLGNGLSSIVNPPYYNGEQQQYPSNSDRPNSPNHARGAVSNGIFGTAKTEAQVVREEKYKQDLKKQMDDKRQRDAEETAKRRAEEERELAKHLEWQHQMEKQVTEDALRKQEKEEQERLHHQKLQEGIEQQRKQDDLMAKRKTKRSDKPTTPNKNDDDDGHRHKNHDEHQKQTETAYRSSSPPVPTLKNKDKKQKSTIEHTRHQSFDDLNQEPPLPPLDTNDDYLQPPPIDDTDGHGRQTYRKPPTPRQTDISTARKKPPQTYRSRPRLNSNSGLPIRPDSAASLRSDGSDSEVLNRLEHLKRQLKDREARLQDHVNRNQTETHSIKIGDHSKTTHSQRKSSPGFLVNPARVHRDSPTTNDVVRRILQPDDDVDYKPSYFRDDTTLLGGVGGHNEPTDSEFFSSMKRLTSGSRKLTADFEKEGIRKRYGHDHSSYNDPDDPTTLANYELNRIAKQNEQRLKKLRDLENDDASLLDSNEVLERFQQKQRLHRGGSQTTLQDDAWLK